jgi:hypothetical protein
MFLGTWRRQSWPLPGTLESLGMEKMKEMRETARMEAVRCIIARGQDAKTEILNTTHAAWASEWFNRCLSY